jgi:hypothetical protein
MAPCALPLIEDYVLDGLEIGFERAGKGVVLCSGHLSWKPSA